MKLISSRKKGRHTPQTDNTDTGDTIVRTRNAKPPKEQVARKEPAARKEKSARKISEPTVRKERREKKSTKTKVLIVLSCIFGLIMLFFAGTFAVVRWQIQPLYDHFFRPDPILLMSNVNSNNNQGTPVLSAVVDVEAPDETTAVIQRRTDPDPVFVEERNPDIFTFLILGIDDHSNTDVVMIASFDSIESKLEIVNIPRDTLTNVSWNLKKINAIHANMRNRYRNESNAEELAMQGTVAHFGDILGFNVDFWVTLNFNGFKRLVDAVGPIEFNVPRSLELDGVSVSRGTQRLNGTQALAVVRTRNVYGNADIGRVSTQQLFLKALAKELIANIKPDKVADFADIFMNHTKTNIQLNHLIWLGREFVGMSIDDINFTILPGAIDFARGADYVTIFVDEWLDIVNNKLSPFNHDITIDDVSILTRGPDRKLYVTDGKWQGDSSWGASSLGPANPYTTND